MSTATKTLKLPFLRLNRTKADEFARLQTLNTATANVILAMPKDERRTLTSKSFAHIEIGSAWINQTIRNANARTKVKQFRCLPLETNNQNWTLHKVGDTYSVSFGLRRGIKKRVPLAIHHAAHQRWLDAVLDGTASLVRSNSGVLARVSGMPVSRCRWRFPMLSLQAAGLVLTVGKTSRSLRRGPMGRSSSGRLHVSVMCAVCMLHVERSCK